MQTIALRFADHFAPPEGTIAAHEALLTKKGYTWYGKIGSPISSDTVNMVLNNHPAKVLLIHSGKTIRYWAYVDAISRECPENGEFPDYYIDKRNNIKCWFRITKFEVAPKDIMRKCKVISSGEPLSYVSRASMSPFFRIETE